MGLLAGHSSSRSVQFCPFACDHDDYQQAIERWNSTAWISTDGKTLYLPDDPRRATLPYADKYCSFHERWATAFTILSISLVLVVVLSAAISQASFREPQARKLEPATLVRWWAFMRWVLMCSVVTLVIGIIQTCLTIDSQLLLFLPRAPGPYPLGYAYGPLDMLTGQNTGVEDPNTSYSTNVRATSVPPPPRTCAVFVRATVPLQHVQQSAIQTADARRARRLGRRRRATRDARDACPMPPTGRVCVSCED